MTGTDETREYYYSGSPVSLRITASSLSIKSMEFTCKPSANRHEPPHCVSILFHWLDNYSEKKITQPCEVILLDNPSGMVPGMKKEAILLDTSAFTDKERKVYRELMKIGPGEVTSYGELAARCGFARGGRFIGNAMAKNAFPVIIPCHRVIKSDGTTGNFSGGVKIKEALLAHEAAGFSVRSPRLRKD